jgi:hypothetical protein
VDDFELCLLIPSHHAVTHGMIEGINPDTSTDGVADVLQISDGVFRIVI